MQTERVIFPVWMRGVLLLMVAYNILWGIFIGWFPESFYAWVTESESVAGYPQVVWWQGRAVLAMAVVYFVPALHPGRFWYLLLFGALTKLAGGIWFYLVILEQQLGDKGIFHLVMNDAVWIPLLLVMMVRGIQYKKSGHEIAL